MSEKKQNWLERVIRSPLAIFYSIRGAHHLTIGQLESAIADLHMALYHRPDDPLVYANPGAALGTQGNHKEAIKALTHGLACSPKKSEQAYILNNRGYFRAILGNLDDALVDCSNAILLSPKMAYAFGSRGHAHFLLGNYEAAMSDFRRSEQLLKKHTFAIAGQAITAHAMGDVENAKQIWRSLIRIDAAYRKADTLQLEWHCADPFVEEARQIVIALMKDRTDNSS